MADKTFKMEVSFSTSYLGAFWYFLSAIWILNLFKSDMVKVLPSPPPMHATVFVFPCFSANPASLLLCRMHPRRRCLSMNFLYLCCELWEHGGVAPSPCLFADLRCLRWLIPVVTSGLLLAENEERKKAQRGSAPRGNVRPPLSIRIETNDDTFGFPSKLCVCLCVKGRLF